MKVLNLTKKMFVRFFVKSRLFSDGYSPNEGDAMPIGDNPDLEVKTRKLADLAFFIPDSAVGFFFFEAITAQIEDNGKIIELSSDETNKSSRHFFQYGKDFGRIAARDEAQEIYDRHTSMRAYCQQPLPEKIILYAGPEYYAHGYSFVHGQKTHTRERKTHFCAFDFLETDVMVPLWYNFAQGFMLKAFAEKKGWIKKRAA